MDLSFIILNYHSEKYLTACISSLEKNALGFKYEIIIINNNLEKLELAFTNQSIQILNTFSNPGFAKGCNLGASIATGKILFFLNPDTKILDDKLNTILPLLADATLGIVAPTLLTKTGKPQPWRAGAEITPLQTVLQNILFKKKFPLSQKTPAAKLAWVSGAAMLIKKDFFEKIGGFDENFFMYFEDVDLCKRVRQFGKKIVLCSEPKVLHYGGGSIENNQLQKKYYYLSQDYYFKKHFGQLQATWLKTFRTFFLALKKLLAVDFNTKLFSFFIGLCALLPFQFALNPTATVDLAIIRILIPLLFLSYFYFYFRKKRLANLPLKQFKNYLLLALKKVSCFKGSPALLILIFLFLNIFSILFSQNIAWSLRKLAFLFSIFPLYFIARFLLNNPHRKRQAISALVFGGATVSLFALTVFGCQFFFGIEAVYLFLAKHIMPFFIGNVFIKEVLAYPSWLVSSGGLNYLRAFAPFPDPHMLSYYTGMLLPWSLALWATSKAHKSFFLAATGLLLLCNIATFTRGGYVALIAAAILTLPFASKETALKIFAGIFLFLFLFFMVPENPVTNPVAGRVLSTFNLQEGSNQGRLAIWKQALTVLASHPQGVGLGNYPLAVKPDATYRTPIYTHNLYLDIAVETGLVNAGIFLALLLLALKNFLQAAKTNSFYLAGFTSLLIFAVHCLVESPLYSVHVLPLLLIILALASTPPELRK
jgi:N-acetylglucosaminyl-diphospho-decaprenol L-rhamnosyltransferase